MLPNETVAIELAEKALQLQGTQARRFPTGLCHYVYDVQLRDGSSVVVRIASESSLKELAGGLYWNKSLKERGIPVARVLSSDLQCEFPHMILERLPGSDLGQVFESLTDKEKEILAGQLIGIQSEVALLESPGLYGYAYSHEDLEANGHQSWRSVLEANLMRSRRWISRTQAVSDVYVEIALHQVEALEKELSRVPPMAFLDDITTKNVIIDKGMLTGIVDTDTICFGDPLYTTALTAMSLKARKWDDSYIQYLLRFHKSGSSEYTRFKLYLLVFCVTFMAELGQPFNGNNDEEVDPDYRRLLEQVFTKTLSSLEN